MSSLALWPAGLAVAGPLAQAFGVTTLCWVSAGLGLVASLWVLFVKDVWRLRPAPVLATAARRRPCAAAGRPAARLTGRDRPALAPDDRPPRETA